MSVAQSEQNNLVDPSQIFGWHAHIYFDASTREAALELRATIERHLGHQLTIGRFNEGPVGPHPMGSYELAISPPNFRTVFEWLALNHGRLDVLVHPETGDDLRDHQHSASWIGHSHQLNLDKL